MIDNDYADPVDVDAQWIRQLDTWFREGYRPSVEELPLSAEAPFDGATYPWQSEEAWKEARGVDRRKFLDIINQIFDAGYEIDVEVVQAKVDNLVIEFKELKDPYESTRIAVEAEIGGLISAWSRRQERTVIERIGGAKARKNTRHWDGEPGTKALDAVYVVNPEQWADDLVDSMEDLIKAIAEKEAMRGARQLSRAGVIDKIIAEGRGFPGGRSALDKLLGGRGYNRDAILSRVVQQVMDMVRESALRQSQKVVDIITDMDRSGATIDEIKKSVRDMIGSRSSWRKGLSIAAATSAMEGGRSIAYEQGGRYVRRVWRTMRDEKVRPSHRRAFGQKRSATKPFLVGGAPLMYPGDLTGPVEETANCRCWVEIEIRDVN